MKVRPVDTRLTLFRRGVVSNVNSGTQHIMHIPGLETLLVCRSYLPCLIIRLITLYLGVLTIHQI